jgi:hypothetical protein
VTARPHLRTYLTSFLYPAVLGAGIAWWVQAVGALVERSDPAPHPWSLWLGLWFLVYHGTWYHHELVSGTGSPAENASAGEPAAPARVPYGWRQGTAGVVDVVALLVAFLGLGFATGSYGFDRVWLTWIAAASIPVAALLNNFERLRLKPLTFASLGVAAAVPIAAFVVPAWSRPPHSMSTLLLVAFWVILGVYIVWPEAFSSGRVRPKPPEPKPSEPKAPARPAPVVVEEKPVVAKDEPEVEAAARPEGEAAGGDKPAAERTRSEHGAS